MKLQAPNPKEAPISKLQFGHRACHRWTFRVGVSLGLVIAIWGFPRLSLSRGRFEQVPDRFLELIKVNRFGEMLSETRCPGLVDVVL
jgi:hypothetical protein